MVRVKKVGSSDARTEMRQHATLVDDQHAGRIALAPGGAGTKREMGMGV